MGDQGNGRPSRRREQRDRGTEVQELRRQECSHPMWVAAPSANRIHAARRLRDPVDVRYQVRGPSTQTSLHLLPLTSA